MALSREQLAQRVALELQDGFYVNLGIGFPEMVARYQPEGREAIFHTENGILNFGEAPPAGIWNFLSPPGGFGADAAQARCSNLPRLEPATHHLRPRTCCRSGRRRSALV